MGLAVSLHQRLQQRRLWPLERQPGGLSRPARGEWGDRQLDRDRRHRLAGHQRPVDEALSPAAHLRNLSLHTRLVLRSTVAADRCWGPSGLLFTEHFATDGVISNLSLWDKLQVTLFQSITTPHRRLQHGSPLAGNALGCGLAADDRPDVHRRQPRRHRRRHQDHHLCRSAGRHPLHPGHRKEVVIRKRRAARRS